MDEEIEKMAMPSSFRTRRTPTAMSCDFVSTSAGRQTVNLDDVGGVSGDQAAAWTPDPALSEWRVYPANHDAR